MGFELSKLLQSQSKFGNRRSDLNYQALLIDACKFTISVGISIYFTNKIFGLIKKVLDTSNLSKQQASNTYMMCISS